MYSVFLTAIISYYTTNLSLKEMIYNNHLDVAVGGENEWCNRMEFILLSDTDNFKLSSDDLPVYLQFKMN